MHPTDIIIRSKSIWIAHSYLLATCSGLSDEHMRNMRSKYKSSVAPSFRDRDMLPDSGTAWRWATINDKFYYSYDNIPDKAPAHYKSQLPTKQELQQVPAAPSADFDTHFKTFLNTHYNSYLQCYGDCTRTQQINLSKAAAIMEGAIEYINANNVNVKKYHFFGQLSAFIQKYDVPYFGSNVRIVKRKIEAVISGTPVVDIIRLPRADNDNAAKGFNDDEIRSWILQLRDFGANYTNTYIIRKVQEMCTLTLKPAPKERWIGTIMQEHNIKYLTSEGRFGKKGRFGARYRGYQPLQNALYAGDCWQIDGTRVNLISHKGENGKPAFLYIIAVRDVHSGDVIGWHFDLTEDRWAVFNAIKMAVKETGYLPYEMIFDKFPGHNTPEMDAFLGDLRTWGVTITMSSDPNVKPGLERWFGTLQTVFMQESKYYYGQGVKSRRNYAHRSEQYINRMRREANAAGFNWDAACQEATNIIENYRNTAYCTWSRKHSTVQQSPAQLHEISELPNVYKIQSEEYCYLFGLKVKLPIDGGGLIKKVIQGVTFYYRIKNTDYEIISKHGQVLVCYDMDDLSQVMLYAITDGPIKQFLGRAYEETPAQRYGPDAQWGVIAQRSALIKELNGFRQQELECLKDGTYDEVTLIAPVSTGKYSAEANETAYLTKNMVISTHSDQDDDETEITFNPRNLY